MDVKQVTEIENMDAIETLDFLLYTFKRWDIGNDVIDVLQEMHKKAREVKYYRIMEAFGFADKLELEV